MRIREQFKREYCLKSNISEEEFDKRFVVLHCNCSYRACQGWAVVSNDSESVSLHNILNTHKNKDL